jgi:predicted MFS family arabinose efflux permease
MGGRILDTYDREKVIFPCLVVQIIAMITLVFSTTFPMLILVAVIWGAGSAFLFPSLVAHALDRAGDARGPAIATYMALADLGAGMGSVIMGIILQLTSYTAMFFCLVVTGVINLLYFYFFVRKRGRDRYANLRVPL